MTDSSEPKGYEESMRMESRKKWEKGMNEEMESLVRNQTWDLVQFPASKRALLNKQVYMFKKEERGKNGTRPYL